MSLSSARRLRPAILTGLDTVALPPIQLDAACMPAPMAQTMRTLLLLCHQRRATRWPFRKPIYNIGYFRRRHAGLIHVSMRVRFCKELSKKKLMVEPATLAALGGASSPH